MPRLYVETSYVETSYVEISYVEIRTPAIKPTGNQLKAGCINSGEMMSVRY